MSGLGEYSGMNYDASSETIAELKRQISRLEQALASPSSADKISDAEVEAGILSAAKWHDHHTGSDSTIGSLNAVRNTREIIAAYLNATQEGK